MVKEMNDHCCCCNSTSSSTCKATVSHNLQAHASIKSSSRKYDDRLIQAPSGSAVRHCRVQQLFNLVTAPPLPFFDIIHKDYQPTISDSLVSLVSLQLSIFFSKHLFTFFITIELGFIQLIQY